MTRAALTFHQVMVQRQHFSLRIDELQLPQGALVVVEGRNGVGKSTLLQAAAGLLPLAEGTLILADGSTYSPPKAPAALTYRRGLAFVMQQPLLFKGTVVENVSYGLQLHGVPTQQARSRAKTELAQLELEYLSNMDARTLSVGQRSLVALCRALVLAPPLLLLDEITAALDNKAQKLVEQHLTALSTSGTTILLTTHEIGMARRLKALRLQLVDNITTKEHAHVERQTHCSIDHLCDAGMRGQQH